MCAICVASLVQKVRRISVVSSSCCQVTDLYLHLFRISIFLFMSWTITSSSNGWGRPPHSSSHSADKNKSKSSSNKKLLMTSDDILEVKDWQHWCFTELLSHFMLSMNLQKKLQPSDKHGDMRRKLSQMESTFSSDVHKEHIRCLGYDFVCKNSWITLRSAVQQLQELLWVLQIAANHWLQLSCLMQIISQHPTSCWLMAEHWRAAWTCTTRDLICQDKLSHSCF